MMLYSGCLTVLLSSIVTIEVNAFSSEVLSSRSKSLFQQQHEQQHRRRIHQNRAYNHHSTTTTIKRQSTSLNVGAELDPEDVLPALATASTSITPEGFGFSTPASRVLAEAKRDGGYYMARASDIVTDVMEGITNGKMDAALVFDDADSQKLLGIFTETDYIKVSAHIQNDLFIGKGNILTLETISYLSINLSLTHPHTLYSSLWNEPKRPTRKKNQQSI
jgi:hypothetical protein